jgi:hypothetical protein
VEQHHHRHAYTINRWIELVKLYPIDLVGIEMRMPGARQFRQKKGCQAMPAMSPLQRGLNPQRLARTSPPAAQSPSSRWADREIFND